MDNSTSPYQPLRGNAYRKQFRQGHVYEAPIFYAQPQVIVARPLHDAATMSGALPANILLQPADLFDHAPFPQLRLAADEEFLVVKTKRRPGIIISADPINLASDTVLVVPLYSADNYKPEFVQRVQESEYPGFLYLATDATFGRKPSIVRFDHLQSVTKSQLLPKPIAVTPETLRQLLETLDRFVEQRS
ncbi:MAG: type II toxin-antitoxin system PemK/MazF family toxin [Chloroflexi bacterium]|nr:type II toxin-antitoxin system PemK/MazF family toxin [Chloroflexota bacterium]